MDKFKAFLNEKKIAKHFKKSGPGARLCDESAASKTPSVVTGSQQGGNVDRVATSDVIAQAALKRLHKDQPQVSAGQKKIQMIALRELEEEKRRQDLSKGIQNLELKTNEPDIREFEHSEAIKGIYYTCELLGDNCLKKADLIVAIEEFLMEQLADESQEDMIIPAILLLYSVNNATIKNAAVDTIAKYVSNIIENPTEPKFRRIRIANKTFQERVATVKGGREYLRAVGFKEEEQSMKDGDPLEPFYVMSADTATDTAKLVSALEALRDGQSIPIKVARNTTIYLLRENQQLPTPKISADFYDLTSGEIKKEQQAKTDEVNRMLTLRTKEMRDKDETLRQYKYKYTLIRIRLPDNYVIEGTFGSYEHLDAVRTFAHSFFSEELASQPWILKDPMINTQEFNENNSLAQLGLVPAAILHVVFESPVTVPILSEASRNAAVPFGI